MLSYEFETAHAYENDYNHISRTLILPGAVGYSIAFDSQSFTERCCDHFTFHSWNGSELYSNAGSFPASLYILSTDGFYWTFKSDVSIAYWGVRFVVTPVCPDGHYFAAHSAACIPCGTVGTSTTGGTVGQTQIACSSCAAGSYTIFERLPCSLVPAGMRASRLVYDVSNLIEPV